MFGQRTAWPWFIHACCLASALARMIRLFPASGSRKETMAPTDRSAFPHVLLKSSPQDHASPVLFHGGEVGD